MTNSKTTQNTWYYFDIWGRVHRYLAPSVLRVMPDYFWVRKSIIISHQSNSGFVSRARKKLDFLHSFCKANSAHNTTYTCGVHHSNSLVTTQCEFSVTSPQCQVLLFECHECKTNSNTNRFLWPNGIAGENLTCFQQRLISAIRSKPQTR
jgi:hypothetical protein